MSLFVQRTVAQLPWRHNICFSEEINKPIGITSWETAIEKDIADKWKSSLPTIEELEAEQNKE